MQEQNIFEGIPSLDDSNGLQEYMTNENLNNMGLGGETSPLLQPENNQNVEAQPNTNQSDEQNVYTREQIAQIIAENQLLRQQMQSVPQQPQVQPQTPQTPQAYTPQQAAAIKQAIDRGIPLDKIMQALGQNKTQAQIVQKLNNVEQYLAQREYQSAQNAFVSKMQDFGAKFGLSEIDLVTFANTALSKGINLTNVDDVEMVFRAIYPEQYSIRMQRINSTPSTIYGGGNIGQTPQESNKQIDAYVENFLKQRMPNQYNKK